MDLKLPQKMDEGREIIPLIEDSLLALSESCDLSGLHEGSSVRACLKARLLAVSLINDKGELIDAALQEAVLALKGHLYSLAPSQQSDAEKSNHMLHILGQLATDRELKRKFYSIDEPLDNLVADRLIRETLHLEPKNKVDVAATRRAVLAALLTPLRQNVGSCFATAPAILVQREQPALMLDDLRELISTGRLSRIVLGVEHSVPLCPSWGAGDLLRPISPAADLEALSESPGLRFALEQENIVPLLKKVFSSLTETTTPRAILRALIDNERELERAEARFKGLTDNALLKAWEFTLASFCELKTSFSRWNLYVSLGLHPDEKEGIGSVIKREVEERLQLANLEVQEAQERYEMMWQVVQGVQGRLRRAPEEEAKWLKADYARKVAEMEDYLDQRDEAYDRAQKLAGMVGVLVERYSTLFPEYFQEVYDPEMHDVGLNPYDDSPAGFRLLYKHGRRNPSVWTLIYTPDEFVTALVDFFISTETGVGQLKQIEGLTTELSNIVGAIIRQLRSLSFLESAFDRMAHRYEKKRIVKPLDNLEKIQAKPWAYVSGGTMAELVATYWQRDVLPTIRERKIENPFDLFVFLLDTLKELPPQKTDLFLQSPERGMLMQSPTHAFVLRPGCLPFREGWLDKGHSPTWIRDQILLPQETFAAQIQLTPEEMEELISRIARRLPPSLRATFVHQLGSLPYSRYRLRDFRDWLNRALEHRSLKHLTHSLFFDEVVDHLLYTTLPLLSGRQVEGVIKKLLQQLFPAAPFALEKLPLFSRYVGSRELFDACLALIVKRRGVATYQEDLPGQLRALMEQEGHAFRRPVLFADTNWVREFFGFLVNPSNGNLELWRTDRLGWEGAPMSRWSSLLHRREKWGVYTHTHEYLR
ncbi:MAG: hypothetical protein JSR80_07775 [Verrucomicrobia bacterium]|nr:hypothetical protein [Verrucomicrobiota bacterium]